MSTLSVVRGLRCEYAAVVVTSDMTAAIVTHVAIGVLRWWYREYGGDISIILSLLLLLSAIVLLLSGIVPL